MKALLVLFLAAAFARADIPTFTDLYAFQYDANAKLWPTGNGPGSIIQGSDGNFYGVTQLGGDDSTHCAPHPCAGTVYRLTPAGAITVLHTFSYGNATAPYADGSEPQGLVEGPDGFLYGTTFEGGSSTTNSINSGWGTIFRISKSGDFQNLHRFCVETGCAESLRPEGVLIVGQDGKLYGVTISSNAPASKGTVYRASTTGVVETLHNFDGFNDGGAPLGGLILASDGNLYGTTSGGGSTQYANGTVYRITPSGDFSVVYTFQLQPPNPHKDGQAPKQPLIQACHGNLYGVTSNGGLYGHGTIFELSLDGNYKTVLDLQSPVFGPNALLLASDGNLWGSSQQGNGIYTVTTSGSVTQTLPFPKACGPGGPLAPLVQAPDGKLYGTLPLCGVVDGVAKTTAGSVFSIDAGLPAVPVPVVAAVTNGASFVSGSLVPGEIATLFGSVLTSATGINLASGLPLARYLLDVDVFVNEIPAPIFAVDNVNGQQQINFQVPWEVAGQSTATIRVAQNCHTSLSVTVPVLAAQPGIISYNSGGTNYGAILHADYQLADSGHPATANETLLIYCTGLGAVSPTPDDGVAANGESTVDAATATIGGIPAAVSFSGLAPGFVGLNQVNVVVPAGLAPGNQSVVLAIGDAASNTVQLPIH